MSQCTHLKTDGSRCTRKIDRQSKKCWQHQFKQSGGESGPYPLQTVTDLSGDSVKKITQTLNPLIADAFALYVKSKNYHWHLYGKHFRDYHLLFDEQADEIFSSIDTLAERVRKLGGLTLKSIGHIGRLQTIQDDDDEVVSSDQMIHRLLNDNRQLAKNQRAAIDICDHEGDTPTGNILQDILDKTERRIWFLFELTQN